MESKHHNQPICKSTEILFKYQKDFDIVYTVSITTFSRISRKTLFPVLKILSLLQNVAFPDSKFGSPDLELLMSDSALNKVVQQIGGGMLPLFLWSFLVDGFELIHIPLPINRSQDETTFYGTNSGIGLFSDSTHSIKQCFHPWDASCALILPSLHSSCF